MGFYDLKSLPYKLISIRHAFYQALETLLELRITHNYKIYFTKLLIEAYLHFLFRDQTFVGFLKKRTEFH